MDDIDSKLVEGSLTLVGGGSYFSMFLGHERREGTLFLSSCIEYWCLIFMNYAKNATVGTVCQCALYDKNANEPSQKTKNKVGIFAINKQNGKKK